MAMAVSPVKKMTRLQQEKVEFILNHDRVNLTIHDPKFEEMEKSYEEFQAWVRAEYAARGFVEFDEQHLTGRAKKEAEIAQFFEENFSDDSEDEE
jgi:hypothetical protein